MAHWTLVKLCRSTDGLYDRIRNKDLSHSGNVSAPCAVICACIRASTGHFLIRFVVTLPATLTLHKGDDGFLAFTSAYRIYVYIFMYSIAHTHNTQTFQ